MLNNGNISYLVLCFFSALEGIVEAILFSRKGADAVKWNEHILFVAVRTAVVSGVFLPIESREQQLIVFVAFMLAYSFCHDEAYYMSRHYIDLKNDNFFTETTTSNAKINFNFPVRLTLFVISLTIILCQPYIHKLI